MKKYMTITVLLLFISAILFAQTKDANISFNGEVHDFGKIEEAKGSVTYRFEFTNTGSTPLLVSQVRPSCGCTTPEWSREPILPGKSGYVAATFDPKNRPGPFNKSIAVITNANPPNKTLRITGDVTPKPKTVEDVYRYDMGKIRLKSNHLGFSKVVRGKSVTKSMEIINNSKEAVSLSFNRIPAHLKVEGKPTKLNPGQEGRIEVTYNSALKNDWGFVSDRIDILQNGEFEARNRMTVSASLEEDFAGMTAAEKANAPKITIDNKTFDFSEIKQGVKVEHEFALTNSGKTDLHIRKIRASCGCTAVNPEKNVIKPGESTTLKVTFNSAGKIGNQNKSITLITNDPVKTREVLWVKGVVVKS